MVGRRRGSETEGEAAAQADSGRPEKEEEKPGAKRNRKHTAGSNAAKRSRKSRMENCPLGVQPRGGHGRPRHGRAQQSGGGGSLDGVRGRGREVIENSHGRDHSLEFCCRGEQRDGRAASRGSEIGSGGFSVLCCFPFKWETTARLCVCGKDPAANKESGLQEGEGSVSGSR